MSIASEVQRLQGAHTALNNRLDAAFGINIADKNVNQLLTEFDSKINTFMQVLDNIGDILVFHLSENCIDQDGTFNQNYDDVIDEIEAAISRGIYSGAESVYKNMKKIMYYNNEFYAIFSAIALDGYGENIYITNPDIFGLVSFSMAQMLAGSSNPVPIPEKQDTLKCVTPFSYLLGRDSAYGNFEITTGYDNKNGRDLHKVPIFYTKL